MYKIFLLLKALILTEAAVLTCMHSLGALQGPLQVSGAIAAFPVPAPQKQSAFSTVFITPAVSAQDAAAAAVLRDLQAT